MKVIQVYRTDTEEVITSLNEYSAIVDGKMLEQENEKAAVQK